MPTGAVETFNKRRGRDAFRYSAEEIELMKQCGGSLKERIEAAKSGDNYSILLKRCDADEQALWLVLGHTSVGILAFILDCGRIVSLSQLHGSESLTQVYIKCLDIYGKNKEMPKLAYDDGCQYLK